jgi:hypothetical protein
MRDSRPPLATLGSADLVKIAPASLPLRLATWFGFMSYGVTPQLRAPLQKAAGVIREGSAQRLPHQIMLTTHADAGRPIIESTEQNRSRNAHSAGAGCAPLGAACFPCPNSLVCSRSR